MADEFVTTFRCGRFRSSVVAALLFFGGVGCGAKVAVVQMAEGPVVQDLESEMQRIRSDPVAFFRESFVTARAVRTLRMKFQRQERLGLGMFKELKPVEHIDAEYRDAPFSVRFTWTDKESEYVQCVYIDGWNDNKVALLPRKGLFGLPPSVGNYSPDLGVMFQKTRNPITDFGPRRMIERTLDRIAKAEPHGGTAIKLIGATEVGPAKEPCFQFELIFPAGDEFACKLQDLYIHTKTKLPLLTYVWMTDKDVRTDDTLDAMYLYGEIEPNILLTDANFVIGAREKASGATGGREVMSAGRAAPADSSD